MTLDDIIDAVNKEDLLCIELVEEIGVKLGRHVAGLINIFNPELVIIGGALSRTGDYLTQPPTDIDKDDILLTFHNTLHILTVDHSTGVVVNRNTITTHLF